MNFRQILIILTLILTPLLSVAQISSPEENFKDTADYNIFNGPDSLFVFNVENVPVTLEGNGPDEDWYEYEWWIYEPGTGYVFIDSDSVEITSIDTITSSAGYMLVTNGVSYSDTSRCWVLINDYSVEIPSLGLVSCGLISDFRAIIDSCHLYYYQPVKDSLVEYPVSYSSNWQTDPDAAANPKASGILQVYVDEPYWEDTYYIIQVSDFSGLIRYDSVLYESIEPHADFEFEALPLDNTDFYPQYSDFYSQDYDHTSAPSIFKFNNNSENATLFEWYYEDGGTDISYEVSDTVVHDFLLPGSYTVTLVAKNEYLFEYCTDTMRLEEDNLVTVDPAEVSIANVLIPGVGVNFRFEDVSVTMFEITIFNRYGKKVHKYKGDIRNWDGWDGTYLHNDNYVPNGVYYYVVRRIDILPDWETGERPDLNASTSSGTDSADDTSPDSKKTNNVYRGFIHVFNQE